ncbi:MAG: hypothetical protein DRQ39_11460 [Gammaproteobacteria bacterium]|nr:MAG: hypothetical protein DRQ39_11460 [Gammaproteobacteria bacterium]
MRSLGHNARISPYRENDHSGFWRVRWDPKKMVHSTTHVGTEVISIERNEIVQPLVDLSVTHQSQLYTLGNGTLTHNCAIGMGYHYRARYEFILFFEKGKRKLNNLGIPDVLSFKRIRSKDAYPTEKPPELLQVLIENSTEPGDLVIDPFMGSGSAGEAALGTGRHFWGNDIAPSSLTRSVARLEPWVRTGEFG